MNLSETFLRHFAHIRDPRIERQLRLPVGDNYGCRFLTTAMSC